MGILKYPGAPDFAYPDDVLATIQHLITTQHKMGQGFWLERRGMDDKTVGHDAIWIDPSKHIYIEFDSLDDVFVNQDLFNYWQMLLTVEGADRLILHPDEETMAKIKKWIADGED
ncbi:DUF7882 family protein [Herbiconiux daphne]|uniref:DUF7882 domain-containing protein n=1 Tax=Herbiconiux daphne TaxID=2970914 RepID=A0ABT2GWR1_9MICO|nr:hypothetical protein [Herbiconiux daphne]MCS5732392.1 hypothetical protein [Herbiconiux daphne]